MTEHETDIPKTESEQAALADILAAIPRRKEKRTIAKLRKLFSNLLGDLAKHGEPEIWKKYGDLLLASVRTAERNGDIILVADLYETDAPIIEIAGESHKTINEIAENYFRRYAKARNAVRIIAERRVAVEADLSTAETRLAGIEQAVAELNINFLERLIPTPKRQKPVAKKTKVEAAYKGVRRFVSSDGYEIWVGKKAVDNDYLTFRISKSLDWWFHASDYPGSHVVIRDSGKGAVPNKTLVEAAELAAFYSDARKQPKADVRYTQRKHVSKPKKAAPGLVSLSSFKTLLVVPQVTAKLKE